MVAVVTGASRGIGKGIAEALLEKGFTVIVTARNKGVEIEVLEKAYNDKVIFVPCDFAAAILYLLYLSLACGGDWFLSFAFPVSGGACIITTALITLLRYVKKGRFYIWGGAFMASGSFLLFVEYLMTVTFDCTFIGWSVYPLLVLTLLGAVLIYLGINKNAREALERKLFF